MNLMLFAILCFILLIYEYIVRSIPTKFNCSLVDIFKRLIDKCIPNYTKEDFPQRKHT